MNFVFSSRRAPSATFTSSAQKKKTDPSNEAEPLCSRVLSFSSFRSISEKSRKNTPPEHTCWLHKKSCLFSHGFVWKIHALFVPKTFYFRFKGDFLANITVVTFVSFFFFQDMKYFIFEGVRCFLVCKILYANAVYELLPAKKENSFSWPLIREKRWTAAAPAARTNSKTHE